MYLILYFLNLNMFLYYPVYVYMPHLYITSRFHNKYPHVFLVLPDYCLNNLNSTKLEFNRHSCLLPKYVSVDQIISI